MTVKAVGTVKEKIMNIPIGWQVFLVIIISSSVAFPFWLWFFKTFEKKNPEGYKRFLEGRDKFWR